MMMSVVVSRAGGLEVRVVRVHLADPKVRVTVLVPPGFPGTDEPFERTVAREHPTIAINGAYFSTTSKRPVGDVVVGGRVLHEGLMGTALAITPDKRVVIRRVTRDRHEDWSGFETVLCCGPALVLDGRAEPRPTEEGFRDPHVMGSTPRMGVGVTRDGDLLLVQSLGAATFGQWAQAMRSLGCRDAMNLDAGASLGMHYRGRTLVSPSRPLTNVLAVFVAGTPRPIAPSSRGPARRHPAAAPPASPTPQPGKPVFDLY